MRKSFSFLLLLLVSFFLAHLQRASADTIAQPTQSDLSYAQALAIAKRSAGPLLSLTQEQAEHLAVQGHLVEFDTLAPKGRAWLFSFFTETNTAYAAMVAVSSPGGEVLQATNEEVFAYAKRVWEPEKGPHVIWSLEDKALFDVLFFHKGLTIQTALPNSQELPKEEALRIARGAVEEAYGVSAEVLEGLEVCFSYWPGQGAPESARASWGVFFVAQEGVDAQGQPLYTQAYQANLYADNGEVWLLYKEGENFG